MRGNAEGNVPVSGGGARAMAVGGRSITRGFDSAARRFADVRHRVAVRRGGWLLVVAGGLSGLYALGALLPFWYLKAPDAGAAFFPPAGLTVAALALTPRRTWP